MSEGTKRTKWALSREALDGLLAALHADRTQAGVRYEQLRLKLVKYFTWERTTFPEERADEALNRLAKRMVEGESIGSVEAYLHGVAHRIQQESLEEDRRERRLVEGLSRMDRNPGHTAEEEEAARCLTGCLSQVTPNNRNLILRYYQGERQNRIQNRQTMAKEFGIPLNALRNRALRLRAKLEECVLRCTERNRGEMFSRVSSQRE